MAVQVELVLDSHAEVGEGPVWDVEEGRLALNFSSGNPPRPHSRGNAVITTAGSEILARNWLAGAHGLLAQWDTEHPDTVGQPDDEGGDGEPVV